MIPARPAKPRDKAKVEVGPQIAQRWILARLRNRRFFSLEELNAAIAERLEEMNDRPFAKLEGCRRSVFETIDRPAMKPLPPRRFVPATWACSRVNIDYQPRKRNNRGAIKSMSRKGDCWDNAVPESFFATMQGECVDHHDFATRRAAIAVIADIDGFYNPVRRHSALDYVSPIEFELKFMSKEIEKLAA